jgi:acetylornithine/N-succinyldiaminopimelate aminotransferase
MKTYGRWPVTFVEGSGAQLLDDSGKSYIDMVAGLAVTSLGHAHPAVTSAVSEQAAKLTHVSNLYWSRPMVELAEALAEKSGGMRSFFCNSGAEAVECAIKLARRWAGRNTGTATPKIIATEGGFHGRTLGALAATGQPGKKAAFEPMLPGFTHVPYGSVSAVAEAMTPDVCAVIVEPIQGEAGVIVPPDGYLEGLRALCDEWNALLILDEVQTGVGRTGSFFAYSSTDVLPDVICLAKGLANGLPIGTCLATPKTAAAFVPGDHATTFGGGPVVCAAALAVLEVVGAPGFLDEVNLKGERLATGLKGIFGDVVRGRGLMLAVELPDGSPHAHAITEAALAAGLLVNDIGDSVLRFVPPLVITDEQIDSALEILGEVWRASGKA